MVSADGVPPSVGMAPAAARFMCRPKTIIQSRALKVALRVQAAKRNPSRDVPKAIAEGDKLPEEPEEDGAPPERAS